MGTLSSPPAALTLMASAGSIVAYSGSSCFPARSRAARKVGCCWKVFRGYPWHARKREVDGHGSRGCKELVLCCGRLSFYKGTEVETAGRDFPHAAHPTRSRCAWARVPFLPRACCWLRPMAGRPIHGSVIPCSSISGAGWGSRNMICGSTPRAQGPSGRSQQVGSRARDSGVSERTGTDTAVGQMHVAEQRGTECKAVQAR